MEKRYLVCDVLFPAIVNLQRGGNGVYSVSGTGKLRKRVKNEIAVSYDFRACRRTYGQVGIDEGVPLDSVSRLMGHATTKTTETYYARKKNEKAIGEAKVIWHRNELNLSHEGKDSENEVSKKVCTIVKPPKIGEKIWVAGYV